MFILLPDKIEGKWKWAWKKTLLAGSKYINQVFSFEIFIVRM